MIVSSFSFGVSGDRLSSLSVAVTSILVHIDLHADVILCLRKFGQKTYCLHAPRDSGKHNHAARLFVGTYRKFAPVCGNISKTQVSNEETYLKESRRQTGSRQSFIFFITH